MTHGASWITRWSAHWRREPAPAGGLPWRASRWPSGTVLHGMRVERMIGRGASAAVYGAIDEASGQAVALKVLDAQPDREQRADLLAAARRAAELEHPGIVRVHGGGEVGTNVFVVMELLPGTDLGRYARAGRLLPEAAVLDVAAQVAEALAYAHRQGVVHRDVKPANVMFDPASRRAVLMDFGLARGADAQATRSGVMLGSPTYMAPELLAGAPPDGRSDLYALGVLTYELLTGRPPFDAAGLGALLRAVASAPPPPLASRRPDLAEAGALDQLLAPLLAKDPAERPFDGAAWAHQARLQALWLTAPPAT
ncbi:MAG TPA: serine/threonine-protein kinase [Burkholderiaceae bacterium]|nr:serine/threonine-protein kinase [Burkholderiaceae bacterium]